MFHGLPLSPRSVHKVNQSHLFWGVVVAPFGWYPSQINNPTRRSVLLIVTQKLVLKHTAQTASSKNNIVHLHQLIGNIYSRITVLRKKHKMRTPFINLYVLLSSSCTYCPLFSFFIFRGSYHDALSLFSVYNPIPFPGPYTHRGAGGPCGRGALKLVEC